MNSTIINVMEMLVPVCALIGVGILCKTFRIFSADVAAGMKNLVTHIFLPVLVFDILSHAKLGAESLLFVAISVGFHFILFAIAKKLRFCFRENGELFPYFVECFECGMIGYSLLIPLVGQENLSIVATLDMGSCIFAFSVLTNGLALLAGENKSKGILYQMLHTPTFLALLAGGACGIFGVGTIIDQSVFSGIYEGAVNYLTAPLTPVILICIGFDLSFHISMIWEILKAMIIRIAVCTFYLVVLFTVTASMGNLSGVMRTTLIMYCMLPPTFLTPIYIKGERQSQFVSGFLSLYILFSLAVFTILIAVS